MASSKINQYMKLNDSGELEISRTIIDKFARLFIQGSKSEHVDEAVEKLPRLAKSRVLTGLDEFPAVFSLPQSIITLAIDELQLKSAPGFNDKADLVTGIYEGGFKVWESTGDLIAFLANDDEFIQPLLEESRDIRVLELGSGSALASIAFNSRFLEYQKAKLTCEIHIQDFNWQVLAAYAILNIAANLPLSYVEEQLEKKNLRLFSGGWKDFKGVPGLKYDIAYMSEILYNSSSYDSLHQLLDEFMEVGSHVFIATKNSYFGLTGGLNPWLEFIESRKVFRQVSLVPTAESNVPRSILVMQKI